MEKEIHLRHYLDVIKRRKFHFIISGILVFLVLAAIAFILPSIYKATATISIESQGISEELLQTSVAGFIEERLQINSQSVLSDDNLLDIVESFGLYTELMGENTSENFIGKMKQDITIEPITSHMQSDRLGKIIPVTTAFTVSFEGREPDRLAEVANHLATLFLEVNARDREEKVQSTIEFLEKQLVILSSEIQETERKLAVFKEKHMSELPELMQLNLKTMDQLERQIYAKDEHIKNLINRNIYLEGQLNLLEPTVYKVTVDGKRIMSPRDELDVLRSEYLSLKASLSKHHPDVIKLNKKLQALEGEVSTSKDLRRLQRELYDKEHQLALLKERVSPAHPDAVKLNKEVMLMRKQFDTLSKKQTILKREDEKPENPAYISLQTSITSTQMEIEAAQKDIKQLQEKYEEYRMRVENTPKVEQAYLDLQRDYENSKGNYQQTANRLRTAKEAKGLEEGRMAENYKILERAKPPEKPFKPNRLVIVLLGLVLGVGSSIGVGSVSEYMDQSVHTADELAEIAGNKVLTVIPYWETSHEVTHKRRRIWILVGSSVAIAAVALVALNLLHTP
jgi:uncharacterized protein involved in exopolysaccharide biosynthesis